MYKAFFDVIVIGKNGITIEEDDFTVTSKETAEYECREIVDSYNSQFEGVADKREFLHLNYVKEYLHEDDELIINVPPGNAEYWEKFEEDFFKNDFEDGGFEEDYY